MMDITILGGCHLRDFLCIGGNDDPKYNIRDPKNLERIDNDFTNLLNKKIPEFIKVLQDNNSDILGITRNYYKKTRTKDKDYWLKLDIKSNIKFKS